MIHKEDEQVCLDVNEQLGGKLEPDGLQLADIVYPKDISFMLFALLNVLRLLRVTDATHCVINITKLPTTNPNLYQIKLLKSISETIISAVIGYVLIIFILKR